MNATGENLKGVSGIYCAIHRDTGFCYVGSSVDVGRRMRKHLTEATSRNRTCFQRALKNLGAASFDFELLESCNSNELHDRERFYIALLNSTKDGFNTIENPTKSRFGTDVSGATRRRLSESQKASEKTRAHCRQMAAQNKGRTRGPLSDETKQKLRMANLGKKASEETRKKMSLASLGSPKSEAHRVKLGRSRIGKTHTPESRKKMSESAKARWHTHE